MNEEDTSEVKGAKSSIQKFLVNWSPVLKVVILGLICFLAFASRIFSVIRYESIIHEFDPWFNYRTTQFLAKEGFYRFFNWYDSESWYPLGRVIGGTIYPGIMSTAALIYWICQKLLIPIEIRNVCVFLAPTFSAFTALSSYLLAKEVTGKSHTGLFAAFFISVVPSYMSRSVAGSYDNEAVAIFALVFTFYLFVKSVNTGSILWSVGCSLSFFYMAASWGGYSFIINIIPLYTLGLLFLGRFNSKVYVAYSVFYVLGTILAIQIPFVGFLAIKSAEHLLSHGVFAIVQAYTFVGYLRQLLPKRAMDVLGHFMLGASILGFFTLFLYLVFSGLSRWSGRSMSLLDPTYASKYIPIIASVSEHQATTWSAYFLDLHFLVLLMPVGFFFCCKDQTETNTNYGKLFIGLYGILAIYFSCVMIRLMLVMAPVACILAAIGISEVLQRFTKDIRRAILKRDLLPDIALIVTGLMGALCLYYLTHSTWAAAEAFSSPSVVMAGRRPGGGKEIIDDFREAYYWLRQNTKEDAKIMSWWDYGYQITGFSNRTVLVDNNTWNNTHIALVGKTMASNESVAYQLCQELDVDYVLVIFGGAAYYSSDDINKFLWMVRIAGGVFPEIVETDYYGQGGYRVDAAASPVFQNSLMYKLCYYKFWEMYTAPGQQPGFDTVRRAPIGHRNYELEHFAEAFTSTHWMVRIYKVKKENNRWPSSKLGKGRGERGAAPTFDQVEFTAY